MCSRELFSRQRPRPTRHLDGWGIPKAAAPLSRSVIPVTVRLETVAGGRLVSPAPWITFEWFAAAGPMTTHKRPPNEDSYEAFRILVARKAGVTCDETLRHNGCSVKQISHLLVETSKAPEPFPDMSKSYSTVHRHHRVLADGAWGLRQHRVP